MHLSRPLHHQVESGVQALVELALSAKKNDSLTGVLRKAMTSLFKLLQVDCAGMRMQSLASTVCMLHAA